MLSVIMLSVGMLNVVMQSVVMLNVLAPDEICSELRQIIYSIAKKLENQFEKTNCLEMELQDFLIHIYYPEWVLTFGNIANINCTYFSSIPLPS